MQTQCVQLERRLSIAPLSERGYFCGKVKLGSDLSVSANVKWIPKPCVNTSVRLCYNNEFCCYSSKRDHSMRLVGDALLFCGDNFWRWTAVPHCPSLWFCLRLPGEICLIEIHFSSSLDVWLLSAIVCQLQFCFVRHICDRGLFLL